MVQIAGLLSPQRPAVPVTDSHWLTVTRPADAGVQWSGPDQCEILASWVGRQWLVQVPEPINAATRLPVPLDKILHCDEGVTVDARTTVNVLIDYSMPWTPSRFTKRLSLHYLIRQLQEDTLFYCTIRGDSKHVSFAAVQILISYSHHYWFTIDVGSELFFFLHQAEVRQDRKLSTLIGFSESETHCFYSNSSPQHILSSCFPWQLLRFCSALNTIENSVAE